MSKESLSWKSFQEINGSDSSSSNDIEDDIQLIEKNLSNKVVNNSKKLKKQKIKDDKLLEITRSKAKKGDTLKGKDIVSENLITNKKKTKKRSLLVNQSEKSKKKKEYEFGKKLFDELYDDLKQKSKAHACKATFFRFLNIIASLIIVIFGAGIGLISALTGGHLFITFGGFIIAIIKGIYDVLQLDHRGIYFKNVNINFRAMIRDFNEKILELRTGRDMVLYVNHIREQMAKIDLDLYKKTYGPENIQYDGDGNVNIEHRKN